MKRLFSILILVFLLNSWVMPIQTVRAANYSGTPYDTYTAGLDNQLAYSAPAYEATNILNIGLDNPQDIYIDYRDYVFIADKGNHRVVQYNPETQEITSLAESLLKDPRGVFVTPEFLYVADYELKAVLKLDLEGQLVDTYGRPTSLLYGEGLDYRPTKVVVDARHNLYITVEGNSNGIVQLNDVGEFVRYFGVNFVTITPELLLRRLLMSEAERDILAPLVPRATTNIAIDSRNLIYSVIYNEQAISMKKINVVGNNILNGNSFYQSSFVDITVDQKGYIYTVSESPWAAITVYDRNGNLLFRFGSNKIGNVRLGQMELASGIAVDSHFNIWVLDKIGNNAQVFVRNEFATMVMGAIDAYENGNYDESQQLYEAVLQQNNNFTLAYIGLGLIHQRHNEYGEALEAFRISNYLQGYSEVFWEFRDQWISQNIGWVILVILLLILARKAYQRWGTQTEAHEQFKAIIERFKQRPFIQQLSYVKKVLVDPKDVFYEIKYKLAIGWPTALILFAAYIGINILSDNFVRSSLFRPAYQEIVLSYEILKYGLILLLLTIGNHLMSSLQNGEGYYRDIFIGTMVSLAPILLFKLPIDLLSNFLTYNESFLYYFSNFVMVAWTAFLLLLMIKDMHNYTVRQLIANLFLTVFTVFILVILYLVIFAMFGQVMQFIGGLWEEVSIR